MGLADEDGYPHAGRRQLSRQPARPEHRHAASSRRLSRTPIACLRPGLFVRVRLPIGQPYQALLVSEEALGTDQGQKFVYVVDKENKAQYRRVQVGKLQNGRRVVTQGPDAGRTGRGQRIAARAAGCASCSPR